MLRNEPTSYSVVWPRGEKQQEISPLADRLDSLEGTMIAMGQKLMDPPSVEGWHTGKEWIDGGTLTERVNFAVEFFSDASRPGVQEIADRIKGDGSMKEFEYLRERSRILLGEAGMGDLDTRPSVVTF